MRSDMKQFQSIHTVHAQISSHILHSIHFKIQSWCFLIIQRNGKEIEGNKSFRLLKWRLAENRAYPGLSRTETGIGRYLHSKNRNLLPFSARRSCCYQLSCIQMEHMKIDPPLVGQRSMATLDTWDLKSEAPPSLATNRYVPSSFRILKHQRLPWSRSYRLQRVHDRGTARVQTFTMLGKVRIIHSMHCLCFQSKTLAAEALVYGRQSAWSICKKL